MPVQELATWEGHWTGHLHWLLWLLWLCWKWGRWWYCESLKIVVSLCLFVYVIVPAQVDYVHVHVCDCPGDCVLPIYANCVYFDVCVCGCVFNCIIHKRYNHLRSMTLEWLAISQQIQDFLFLLSMILVRYRIPWWYTFIGNLWNALQKRVWGRGVSQFSFAVSSSPR